MEDKKDVDSNITKEEYDLMIKQFKDRNKRGYDFLTTTGEEFQDSIYKLCKRMIRDEQFPGRFSETILYNLWNRNGSREDLNNHRYIHLKDWLPRLTESLTENMMKETIFEGHQVPNRWSSRSQDGRAPDFPEMCHRKIYQQRIWGDTPACGHPKSL